MQTFVRITDAIILHRCTRCVKASDGDDGTAMAIMMTMVMTMEVLVLTTKTSCGGKVMDIYKGATVLRCCLFCCSC